ncbi:tetratricopeptide repeat protein [bacterium]|nr:tetratricopeptide repeat protein [bacterium]
MERKNIIIILCLAFLIILKLVSGFLPGNILWGFDFHRFLPQYLQIIILSAVIVIAFVIIMIAGVFKESIERVVNFLAPKTRFWFALAFSLFAGAIFLLFRVKTYFLGDGYMIARSIVESRIFLFNEPLDVLIHLGFFKLLSSLFSFDIPQTYIAVSVFSGMVFIFILVYFIRQLGESLQEQLVTLMVICTSASILLFFGYIESYSIVSVFLIGFLLSSIKSVRENAPPYVPSLLFGLCVITHTSTISLFPAILFLWIRHIAIISKERSWVPFLLKGLGLSIMPTVLVLVVMIIKGDSLSLFGEHLLRGDNLLPIIIAEESIHVSYSLFSLTHLLELSNEILLISPIFLIGFILFIVYNKKIFAEVDHKWLFLAIASLGYLIFAFLFNMKKGCSRDWDLLAPMAFPLILFTMRTVYRIKTRINRIELYLITVLLLMHFIPWVALNAKEEWSLKRSKTIVNDPKWSARARADGLDELRYYYETVGEIDSAYVYARRAVSNVPSSRYLYNWGVLADKLGYKDEARQKLGEALEKNPDYVDAYLYYSGILYLEGKYQEALDLLAKADVRFQNPQIHLSMGLNWDKLGHYIEAAYHFMRVTEMKPDYYQAHIKLIVMLYKAGRYERALHFCEEAQKHFKTAQLYYNTALVLENLERLQEAGMYYQEAIKLDPNFYDPYVNLADMLIRNSQFKDAVDIYRLALERFNKAELHYLTAMALLSLEENEEAIIELQKTLEMNPDFKLAEVLLQELEKKQHE